MAIAITTPTGNVGGRVIENLLAAGADLILLTRHPEKLSESVRQRVKVFQGSLADPAFVVAATQAVEALFWVSPNNFTAPNLSIWYDELSDAVTQAVQTHKIPYVVNLSSVGAHLATGMGPISELYKIEQRLNQVATNIIHLRPDFFMENYLHQLETIQTHASVFLPLAGKQRFAMIATRDIATVAANFLLHRTWNQHSIVGLHGAANISFDEAATVLSEVLEQPIHHVEITSEQFYNTMISQGTSPDAAAQYTQMWRGLSDPDFTPAEPRTPKNATPTTFDQFAREQLKPLLNMIPH